MLNLLKKFLMVWAWKIRFTVYIIVGAVLLLCLFLAHDVRFMSNKEVLECLTRIYDQEFTIQSSHNLAETERAADVWRVKVYEVVPAEETEQQFWAFNIVTGESGGIFGAANGLLDTYSAEIMLAAFEKRAAQAGLPYELTYYNYPCQAATEYYSGIYVNIELAAVNDWPALYELVAAAAKDALAQLPSGFDYAIAVDFVFIYREQEWPQDKFYPLRVTPFNYEAKEPMSTADIEEEIASELHWYMQNYDVWKKINK